MGGIATTQVEGVMVQTRRIAAIAGNKDDQKSSFCFVIDLFESVCTVRHCISYVTGTSHRKQRVLTPFHHSTLHIEHFALPPFKKDIINIPTSICAFIYKFISLLQGFEQGHLHPLHRAYQTYASQSRIEPGTSCTAGELSIQSANRKFFSAIRNFALYYYKIS